MKLANKKKKKKSIFTVIKKSFQNRKKHSDNIKGFKFYEVVIIVLVTSILCTIATGTIFYYKYNYKFENLNSDSNINKFLQVYESIQEEYYEDVDNSELINSAINGMFSYLDDYSEELSKEDKENLLEQLAGEYEGIGIEIIGDKIVYSVFAGSPAEKAGIMKNDQIIKVNDEDMSNKDNAYIANLIKGYEKDNLTITVKRNDQELTFEVVKDELYIPSVVKEIKEVNGKKIGYISISTFSNTTARQFETALKDMEANGIESLIVDVRNNSGGYLAAANDIASMFLDKGRIIYSLQDKKETKDYKDETSEKREYKVVVLINEYSASASEVLAAALKDSYGATIVGKKSYGKGKVQQTLNLSDGSMAKYTTAKWLRPNGECIDKKGINPDYEEDLQISEDQQSIIDTQLNKALEILSVE